MVKLEAAASDLDGGYEALLHLQGIETARHLQLHSQTHHQELQGGGPHLPEKTAEAVKQEILVVALRKGERAGGREVINAIKGRSEGGGL